jgi:hypothetical protein
MTDVHSKEVRSYNMSRVKRSIGIGKLVKKFYIYSDKSMCIKDKIMDFSEYFEIFLMNDQPTTCPKCGCRTDHICDLPDSVTLSELHICLSNIC